MTYQVKGKQILDNSILLGGTNGIDSNKILLIADWIINHAIETTKDIEDFTNDKEFVSKEYVDNISGGGGDPAGTNGSIQYNNNGVFGGSDIFTFLNDKFQIGDQIPNTTSRVDIKSDGSTISTTHTRLVNSLENILLQLYDNGIIKITETEDIPAAETGFCLLRLNTNGQLIATIGGGVGDVVLSIDRLQSLLDVNTNDLQTGDLLIFDDIENKFINQSSQEFDLIIKKAETNIFSNVLLNTKIPAGYKIDSILCTEINNIDIGNIIIGSTLNGSDIVETTNITANYDNLLQISKNYYSRLSDTDMYIECTDWDLGMINLYFTFIKIT